MTMPKRILLIEDTDAAGSPAWHRAAELARRSGAGLRICRFVFDPLIDFATGLADPSVHRRPKADFLRERQALLETAKAELAAQGVQVDTELVWTARPQEALVAKAIQYAPDLVVANVSREPDLFGVRTLSPRIWQYARLCPAPLMLVQAGSPALPARIGVAVDTAADAGDESLNLRLLDAGRGIAAAASATLRLVHVFPFLPLHSDLAETYERVRDNDVRDYGAFCERAGVAKELCRWRSGSPAEELRAFAAEENCDLLVAGAVYRNALQRLFLGSTAEALIPATASDVLIVKPVDFLGELARHRDLDQLCAAYGVSTDGLRQAA